MAPFSTEQMEWLKSRMEQSLLLLVGAMDAKVTELEHAVSALKSSDNQLLAPCKEVNRSEAATHSVVQEAARFGSTRTKLRQARRRKAKEKHTYLREQLLQMRYLEMPDKNRAPVVDVATLPSEQRHCVSLPLQERVANLEVVVTSHYPFANNFLVPDATNLVYWPPCHFDEDEQQWPHDVQECQATTERVLNSLAPEFKPKTSAISTQALVPAGCARGPESRCDSGAKGGAPHPQDQCATCPALGCWEPAPFLNKLEASVVRAVSKLHANIGEPVKSLAATHRTRTPVDLTCGLPLIHVAADAVKSNTCNWEPADHALRDVRDTIDWIRGNLSDELPNFLHGVRTSGLNFREDGAPIRPKTAYFLFVDFIRPFFSSENPHPGVLANQITQFWKELEPAMKKTIESTSQQLWQKYHAACKQQKR